MKKYLLSGGVLVGSLCLGIVAAVAAVTPLVTTQKVKNPSTVPIVEFQGKPSISLSYDKNKKESLLTGKVKVKVTTGTSDIKFFGNYISFVAQFRSGGNFIYANSMTSAVTSSSFTQAQLGNEIVLKANTAYTFEVTKTVKPAELFAGSYTLAPVGFYYQLASDTSYYYQYIAGSAFKSAQSSNSVTIIGETSPYITSAYQDPDGFVEITGVRFSQTSNQVTLAGKTMTYSLTSGAIKFLPSDFGITTSGSYVLQIATSNGASNRVSVGISVPNGTTLATLERTSGFVGSAVPPNSTNVKIGSFVFQAGSEDVQVSTIDLTIPVTNGPQTNISNLRIAVGATTVGGPLGSLTTDSMGFGISPITVSAGTTLVFDVYADIGSDSDAAVTTGMSVRAEGLQSHAANFVSASGVTITSSSAFGALVPASLSGSSPVSQFIVGGSNFGIATFSLKTQSGVATVRELRFAATGTDAFQSVTVNGVTAPVVGNTATVTGLSIPVSATGTDIPVTIRASGFQNTTTGGSLMQTIQNISLSLTYIEAVGAPGSVTTNTVPVSSNPHTLVASKPTVTVSPGTVNNLILGAENKIGEFTVTADANGRIALSSVGMLASVVGVTSPSLSSARIADGATTITNASVLLSGMTLNATFSPSYQIAAGQSKTFSVYAVVDGTQQSGITPYVTTRLYPSTFMWRDTIGGDTPETGDRIVNFPTNSFVTGNSSVLPASSSVSTEDVDVENEDAADDEDTSNATPGPSPVSSPAPASTPVVLSVKVSASPTSVVKGKTTTVSWTSTGAVQCEFADDLASRNSGAQPTQGSVTVTPSKSKSTYTVKCTDTKKKQVKSSVTVAMTKVLGVSIRAVCTDLPRNLTRGNESAQTYQLQAFLIAGGYLSGNPTGLYGSQTVDAVKAYQSAKGLPQTGMVYDFTRASIKADSCQ